MRQIASRIRSKHHEPRNKLRVDPVGFGTRAPAGRESLDLRRRQLPGHHTCAIKDGPQTSFLTAGCLEADQGAHRARQIDKAVVPYLRIGQPQPLAVWQAMNIQPVAADIYSNDLVM